MRMIADKIRLITTYIFGTIKATEEGRNGMAAAQIHSSAAIETNTIFKGNFLLFMRIEKRAEKGINA